MAIKLFSSVRIITVFPLPTTGIETILRFDFCLLFFTLPDLATTFGLFGDSKCLYLMVSKAATPLLVALLGLTWSN